MDRFVYNPVELSIEMKFQNSLKNISNFKR